jgi:hypothetical protein
VLKNKLMGSGYAALAAEQLAGRGGQGLIATGSSATDALLIDSNMNAFGTVGSGTGAIISSAMTAGDALYVFNGGSNNLTVYPPTGATIDATTSATLTPGKGMLCQFATDTKIVTHKST